MKFYLSHPPCYINVNHVERAFLLQQTGVTGQVGDTMSLAAFQRFWYQIVQKRDDVTYMLMLQDYDAWVALITQAHNATIVYKPVST